MRQGFTLIQISLLLLVSSLVLVTVLPSVRTKLNNDNDSTTKLNTILVSLRQYQASHGRLPCPADASMATGNAAYGVEAADPGHSTNCTGGSPAGNYIDAANNVAIGMVPVQTLGLSKDYALDNYGREITYAVDTNATDLGWATATLAGKVIVTDNGTPANTIVALVSHGADGHGAWIPLTGASGTAVRLNAGSSDADQLTNAHVNGGFVATSVLTNFVSKLPTATFDDLIVYKNPQWNINVIPAAIPQITSITKPNDGCYDIGKTLTFQVTYNTNVTVTGTPRLDLTMGATEYANYASGSGTTQLTFSYTIQNGDNAPTGITLAPAVDPNGGGVMMGLAYAVRGFTVPDLSHVVVKPSCAGDYLAVGHDGAPYVTLYSFSGGTLTKLPAPAITPAATSQGYGVDFSPDNSTLAWAGATSSSGPIEMIYNVTSAGLTGGTNLFNGGSYWYNNSSKFSPGGNYLAVQNYCCLFFTAYAKDGNTYDGNNVAVVNNTLTNGGDTSSGSLAWKPDSSAVYTMGTGSGKMYTFSRSNGATFTLSKTLDLSSLMGYSKTVYDMSLHPSGNYLAIATDGPASGEFLVIKDPDNTATPVTSGLPGPDLTLGLAWSHNGKFIGVGKWNSTEFYSFDTGTDTFTPATVSGSCTGERDKLAWSPDDNYVAVTTWDNTTPLCLYHRVGTTFTVVPLDPSLQPAGSGRGVAFSKPNYIYVADENNQRVQKFDAKGNYITQFGQYEYSTNQPESMAIDSSSNVWVINYSGGLSKFDSYYNYITTYSGYGSSNGDFIGPGGMVIDASGNLWIVDAWTHRVQELNSSGAYIGQIGCPTGPCTAGSGNGQFNFPGAMTLDSGGNFWIVDVGNNRVQEINSSGTYVSQFGSCCWGNSDFYNPSGIAIDASGNVWVSGWYNNRVSEFTSTGTWLRSIGGTASACTYCGCTAPSSCGNNSGSGNGQLSYPGAIAFDASGNLLVADNGNSRIEKFDSAGNYISQFGTSGSGNGQFNGPADILIPGGKDIDPPSPYFVKYDNTTKGNWQGTYGQGGYYIGNSVSSAPSYASFNVYSNYLYTWASNTGDPRALTLPGGGDIASCYYTPSSGVGAVFSFEVNITDGHTHQVALYLLDWDSSGPRQVIVQMLDSSGTVVLDTRGVNLFQGGRWLVYNVSGHIFFTVTNEVGGSNAVASGVFFGN